MDQSSNFGLRPVTIRFNVLSVKIRTHAPAGLDPGTFEPMAYRRRPLGGIYVCDLIRNM